MLLDDAMALCKLMVCVVSVTAFLVEGVGGILLLPAAKVGKKKVHQLTSTAGDKEVGGRRRRQHIMRGVGPGGWEAMVQGEAEVVAQQPVRVDNERQRQDSRWRRRQTGGGGVSRCNATTSQGR